MDKINDNNYNLQVKIESNLLVKSNSPDMVTLLFCKFYILKEAKAKFIINM